MREQQLINLPFGEYKVYAIEMFGNHSERHEYIINKEYAYGSSNSIIYGVYHIKTKKGFALFEKSVCNEDTDFIPKIILHCCMSVGHFSVFSDDVFRFTRNLEFSAHGSFAEFIKRTSSIDETELLEQREKEVVCNG